MRNNPGRLFLILGLLSLLAGTLFGLLGSFQFDDPELLPIIPFIKSRPLHVSLVVSWIFLSVIGGIYYYLPNLSSQPLYSPALARIHFWLFTATGIAILAAYFTGLFGGREYWEFPPILGIPVALSWVFFLVNFFKTVSSPAGRWPVYYWMWGTGIIFFLFTFLESYLYLIPWFGGNTLRDLTVQWKAYGALVGSWNMLVYGTAIYVMEKTGGESRATGGKLPYLMFLLGFVNLLFGWGHHIYPVPVSKWIRIVSYAVSMTELLILARIIWKWKNDLGGKLRQAYPHVRFFIAADQWIVLNLVLAIAISIPAINIFTHGTHITVAHAMGSTIGINTMILMGSLVFIATHMVPGSLTRNSGMLRAGFWICNISLLFFWIFLILAGAEKGLLTREGKLPFQAIMAEAGTWVAGFAVSGIFLFIGIVMIALPLLGVFAGKKDVR